MKTLTIAIPTYNRKEQLIRCLDSIIQSDNFSYFSLYLEILVIDNDSNYCIYDSLMPYVNKFPNVIKVLKNNSNIGMANNFKECFKKSSSYYIWLLSDDEFINRETLSNLIPVLIQNSLDLIFINNSRKKKNIGDKSFDIYNYTKDTFIRKVSIFNTLVSKNIFSHKYIYAVNYSNSSFFPFLFPFYEALNSNGSQTLFIDADAFEVTSGGSSGYKWFETFIYDLGYIHNKYLKSKHLSYIQNQLIKYLLFKQFLIVGLSIKKIKRNTLANFEKQNFKEVYLMIRNYFRNRINFYIFILPIFNMPKFIRNLFYKILMDFFQPFYRKKD